MKMHSNFFNELQTMAFEWEVLLSKQFDKVNL
jgi:hypothetical protein